MNDPAVTAKQLVDLARKHIEDQHSRTASEGPAASRSSPPCAAPRRVEKSFEDELTLLSRCCLKRGRTESLEIR
jgi:hypothetical protein